MPPLAPIIIPILTPNFPILQMDAGDHPTQQSIHPSTPPPAGGDRRSRKRPLQKAFLESLMSRVLEHQEAMHLRLLDSLERRLAAASRERATILSLLRGLAGEPSPAAAPRAPFRWTEPEVEALIELRSGYTATPPGLWEEIADEMGRLGFHRNACACKKKWLILSQQLRNETQRKRNRSNIGHLDSLYGNDDTLPSPESQVPATNGSA